MNVAPLTNAGPIVYSHALLAMAAMLVGASQLMLSKGTSRHKYAGWSWVVLMTVVAVSSFGIHEIRMLGSFSPIHLLSVFVLYSLWEGMRRIRRGDIAGHRRTMVSMYIYGMLLTGALTLLPGRVLHSVFFGVH